MGMAAPGVEVDREEDLAMETALERSQRPSTRPTTARESRARTGEPLWPSVTGWLRRKTWAADVWLRSKWQKGHFVVAGEGIWSGEKNGDIVFWVHSDDGRPKKARRTI